MTIALKAIDGGSKQCSERNKPDSKDKSIRPHCKISIEDINWVRQQPPCVQQLWLDSVAAEQFGGAAHKLETNLTYKSFQKAGAALTAQGLFQFEEVFGRLPSGRPGLIGYRVRNLHGYYNRFYWESYITGETNSCNEKVFHAEEKTNQAEAKSNHPDVEQIHPDLEQFQKNGQKSEQLQGFQNPNNVPNYSLTTNQQPTKVVGLVVGSDAPDQNSWVEETAIAPLGGASPSVQDCASEEEEPPTVADCTLLPLVDAVQSQSASLLVENQDLGVEREVPGEDTFPAAPAAQNQKFSTLVENEDLGVEPEVLGQDTISAVPTAQNENSSTYAEMKLHPEHEYSASLPADNLIYCAEPSNLHELTHSAPQVEVVMTSTKNGEQETSNREQGYLGCEFNHTPNEDNLNPAEPPVFEKWSLEAIAQRSQLRPARTAKLNTAKALGESPGFEYLQECWEEDPGLQITIKKLLVKFPQWGIACVEGRLVDGNT